MGEWSAKVTATGKTIVSTTPYSMGCVEVPLGPGQPASLSSDQPAVPEVRPGISDAVDEELLGGVLEDAEQREHPDPDDEPPKYGAQTLEVDEAVVGDQDDAGEPDELEQAAVGRADLVARYGLRHRVRVDHEHDQQPPEHRRAYRLVAGE